MSETVALSNDGTRREVKRVTLAHLDDSFEDAEIIRHHIDTEFGCAEISHVSTGGDFEALLKGRKFDLILCDYGIPGYDGFTALRFAQAVQPGVPVIMISGTLDDAQAVESLKRGATDYILKQRLARLVPAIRRALREGAERRIRDVSEERIRQQAELLNIAHDGIVVHALDGRILFWNNGAQSAFGWTSEEACGKDVATLLHIDAAALETATAATLIAGHWVGEISLKTKSGSDMLVFTRWSLWRSKDGEARAIFSASTDVTEKKRFETQALRAQRVDTIGALAGGIAHDLNNVLAPVRMSVDLVRDSASEAERARFLEIIASSTDRATGLVKQILGFARGKPGEATPILLSYLVSDMAKMIRDTFPKSIKVRVVSPESLWNVSGDSTELHQVILNLCVNARDAMPTGGTIDLSLNNCDVDAPTWERLGLPPGRYVRLSIADSGAGIPPDILPRIFEPFFTTKQEGGGTGLGLSTVASIVRNHKGAIDVTSEVGRGGEFRIYLPALDAPAGATPTLAEAPAPFGNGELILVIDDEEAVRELAKAALESQGYAVITAQNGLQGVRAFEERKTDVRLIVSDTDMPVMGGLAAIQAIKKLCPDLPVVVASGGKTDSEEWQKLHLQGIRNIGKPYTLEQLLRGVGNALKGKTP